MIDFKELPVDFFASIGSYLQTTITEYAVFFEGSEARRDNSDDPLHGIEIRINGPEISTLAKAQYMAVIDIDLLITLPITEDLFEIHRAVGVCIAALNKDIAINGLSNNGFIGCLSTVRRRKNNESVETQHYGQIDANKMVLQASVAAEYNLLFCEE